MNEDQKVATINVAEEVTGDLTDLSKLVCVLAGMESNCGFPFIETPPWDGFFSRKGGSPWDTEVQEYRAWIDENQMECCASCIAREVRNDGQTKEEKDDIGYDGYVLFSVQDANVFDDEGNLNDRLYFSYGSFQDKSDEGQLAIAKYAVECFQDSFDVEWSGRLSERFCLLPHASTGRRLPLAPEYSPQDFGKRGGPCEYIYPKINHFRLGTGA